MKTKTRWSNRLLAIALGVFALTVSMDAVAGKKRRAATAENLRQATAYCEAERSKGNDCFVRRSGKIGGSCGKDWTKGKSFGGKGKNYATCKRSKRYLGGKENEQEAERRCAQLVRDGMECKVKKGGIAGCGRGWSKDKKFGGKGKNYLTCKVSKGRLKEAQCWDYCDNNDDCEDCRSHSLTSRVSLNGVCGKGMKRMKSWKGKGRNWHACKKNAKGRGTEASKAKCEAFCSRDRDCQRCRKGGKINACGKGYKKMEAFRGKGKDWIACEKNKRGERTDKNKAACLAWCSKNDDCRLCKKGGIKGCGKRLSKMKGFKDKGKKYIACEYSKRGERTAKKLDECETYCAGHKKCTGCEVGKCRLGYKSLKKFKKRSKTVKACSAGRLAEDFHKLKYEDPQVFDTAKANQPRVPSRRARQVLTGMRSWLDSSMADPRIRPLLERQIENAIINSINQEAAKRKPINDKFMDVFLNGNQTLEDITVDLGAGNPDFAVTNVVASVSGTTATLSGDLYVNYRPKGAKLDFRLRLRGRGQDRSIPDPRISIRDPALNYLHVPFIVTADLRTRIATVDLSSSVQSTWLDTRVCATKQICFYVNRWVVPEVQEQLDDVLIRTVLSKTYRF